MARWPPRPAAGSVRCFATLIGWALIVLPALAARLPLQAVLDRTAAYLSEYETRLSALVAEERYVQKLSRGNRHAERVLVSDYVLLRLPGDQAWIGFRDTYEVDGWQVREPDARLERLLSPDGPDDALAEASRIVESNSQYDLGDEIVHRSINAPTWTLDLLHPRNRDRIAFDDDGEKTVDGLRVRKIAFKDVGHPPLVTTPAGDDQVTRGHAWIDPESGAVVRTDMTIRLTRSRQATLRVDYRRHPTLGLYVPARMLETYRQGRTLIEATATYTNFRTFQTSARLIAP